MKMRYLAVLAIVLAVVYGQSETEPKVPQRTLIAPPPTNSTSAESESLKLVSGEVAETQRPKRSPVLAGALLGKTALLGAGALGAGALGAGVLGAGVLGAGALGAGAFGAGAIGGLYKAKYLSGGYGGYGSYPYGSYPGYHYHNHYHSYPSYPHHYHSYEPDW